MAMKLNPNFDDYLRKLSLTPKSLTNYRQYVRWIERHGPSDITLDTDLGKYVEEMAEDYQVKTHYRFNPRGSAKCVIRHYQKFLESVGVEKEQNQLEKEGAFDVNTAQEGKEKVSRSIALRRGQVKFRQAIIGRIRRTLCGD
jgi:hypothetical protein